MRRVVSLRMNYIYFDLRWFEVDSGKAVHSVPQLYVDELMMHLLATNPKATFFRMKNDRDFGAEPAVTFLKDVFCTLDQMNAIGLGVGLSGCYWFMSSAKIREADPFSALECIPAFHWWFDRAPLFGMITDEVAYKSLSISSVKIQSHGLEWCGIACAEAIEYAIHCFFAGASFSAAVCAASGNEQGVIDRHLVEYIAAIFIPAQDRAEMVHGVTVLGDALANDAEHPFYAFFCTACGTDVENSLNSASKVIFVAMR